MIAFIGLLFSSCAELGEALSDPTIAAGIAEVVHTPKIDMALKYQNAQHAEDAMVAEAASFVEEQEKLSQVLAQIVVGKKPAVNAMG